MQPSNHRALQGVARDIIARPVGDRLDTTLGYQHEFQVGAGTVQKALQLIKSIDAAELRAAGHQGTFIVSKDIGLLWNLAGLAQVRVLLTPPGPVELYGLSLGLSAEFDRLEIPLVHQYARGADTRLSLLREREADLTVVSAGVAKNLADDPEWSLWDIGGGTYYSAGSLQIVSRAGSSDPHARGQRIGIDRSSSDHSHLTTVEFDEARHTFVDCSFQQIPTAILENRIDAGIWHRMLLLVPLELIGLEASALDQSAAATDADSISGAVLVARSDNSPVTAVVDAVDLRKVRKRQSEILDADPAIFGDGRVWFR